VAPDRVAALKAAAACHRNAARLRPEILLPVRDRPAGPPALAKLAAAEDWDDPCWRPWAVRVRTNVATFQAPYLDDADAERRRDEDARNNIDNFFKRSRGTWERAQFLYGLDQLGLLERGPRALVLSAEVDGFYLMLTELARAVGVVDVGPGAPAHAERVGRGDRDPWLAKPRRFHRDRIAIHHGMPGPELFADAPWDAAVLPQNTLSRLAVEGKAAALLAWIGRRLAPGGVLAFSAEIRLNGRPGVPGLTPRQALALGDALADAGMELPGSVDLSLSDATLDRFVTTGAPGSANPNFVIRTGEALHITAVWFARKRADTPGGGWERLARFLA
ncbi:glycosyl transferase, partial [Azospirillum sp. C340-1]|nr:glycosyl transferase [Azospirillum isscasi]